jgi:hypothetical protein
MVYLSFFIGFSQKIDFFSYFLVKNVSFQPMKKRYFFEKLDRRSWELSSEKFGLDSSMEFHLLFRTVETTSLHLTPIKNYSKNTHPSSIFK